MASFLLHRSGGACLKLRVSHSAVCLLSESHSYLALDVFLNPAESARKGWMNVAESLLRCSRTGVLWTHSVDSAHCNVSVHHILAVMVIIYLEAEVLPYAIQYLSVFLFKPLYAYLRSRESYFFRSMSLIKLKCIYEKIHIIQVVFYD